MPKIVLLTAIVIQLMAGGAATAHPSHSSMTEIEWNATSQRFEVAMRLSISDLEDAISVRQNRRFRLEANSDTARLVQQYLKDQFAVTSDEGHDCRLHWVGMELELHDAWFYFEAESLPSGNKVEISSLLQQANNQRSNELHSRREQTVATWEDLMSSKTTANDEPSIKGKSLRSVVIRNAALTDVQPEQTNFVSISVGKLTSSAVLTARKPQHALELTRSGIRRNFTSTVE